MRKKLKAYSRWLQILGVGAFLLSLQMLRALAASSAQLYIKPASQTLATGQTVSAAIRLNINQTYYVGYVKAYISFPADKLKVTNLNSTNSDFNKTVEESYDNNAGVIKIQRSGGKYHTGDYLVVRVVFQAKSPGTAKVNFSSSQASYYSYSANELTSSVGATYTIPGSSTPAPPSTTTQPTSQPSSSSSSTTQATQSSSTSNVSNASQPASSSLPLSAAPTYNNENSDGTVSYDYGYDYADLKWSTPTPSTAVINYGLDPQQQNNVQTIDQKQTDFTTTIGSLLPGKLYYFTINTTGDKGQVLSFNTTLTTKGYPVEITLLSKAKKPLKDVQVSIGDFSGKTSASGKTNLNLPAGSQQLSVTSGKYKQNFTVNIKDIAVPADHSDPELQRFSFTLPIGNKLSNLQKLSIIVISILLIIFTVGLVLFLRGRPRGPDLPFEFLQPEPDVVPNEPASSSNEFKPETSSNKLPELEAVQPVVNTASIVNTALHPHSVARTIKPLASSDKGKKNNKSKEEPKDMFDMAEERFKKDERLKDFR